MNLTPIMLDWEVLRLPAGVVVTEEEGTIRVCEVARGLRWFWEEFRVEDWYECVAVELVGRSCWGFLISGRDCDEASELSTLRFLAGSSSTCNIAHRECPIPRLVSS